MELSKLISEALNCLKSSFKLRAEPSSTIADKMFLTMYIDFIKNKIIQANEKASSIFSEFENNYENLKVEGKLEGYIEMGLEGNKSIQDELIQKIGEIKMYLDQRAEAVKNTEKPTNLNIEQNIEKASEVIQEQKDEKDDVVIEQKYDEDDIKDEDFEDVVFEEDVLKLNDEGTILVPWDFSTIAEYALEHAIMYSKAIKGDINLVHIVKKDREIPAAMDRIKKTLEEINQKYGVKPNYLIREGSIFDTITEIATHTRAKLVIMATHGMRGMQKFTGSWALKVIVGTASPFIVVQEPPIGTRLNKILFPVDHTKETRQKLNQAEMIAKAFPGVKFEILRLGKVSIDLLDRQTTTNMNYVRSYMRQNNIKHEVFALEGSSLADAVTKYAPKTNADLIMTLTTKNINLADFVVGPDEQKVIFNDSRIPVMCINPKKVKYAAYTGFSGGG